MMMRFLQISVGFVFPTKLRFTSRLIFLLLLTIGCQSPKEALCDNGGEAESLKVLLLLCLMTILIMIMIAATQALNWIM